MTTDDGGRRTTKVERLIEEYDLRNVGQELEAHWTGDGRKRKSLRDLEDYFNRRLVESALRDAGMNPLEREGENYYDLLTDENNAGSAVEVEARLKRNNVDVNALTDDFVTYQAIRNYLKDVREAEYEQTSDGDQVEKELDGMERLIVRTENVATEKVSRLAKTGRLTVGSFRVFVSVDILCEDCDTQFGIIELLRRGGCECHSG
ncbi:hypothetical protein BRC91_12395 [Halobacteriales archaeon QS_4_62_28]|nr:MAG: hypothetical protein BRC91_12395 [Halobacteriales archaeon QS_4_62_28]